MQKFTIGKNEAGQRFDKFLAKYMPAAPKSLIYKMLRKKNITLNGKKATGNEMLNCADTVESFFSDETFDKFTASASNNVSSRTDMSVPRISVTSKDIVYEDEHILLVNKKPGVLTQKANPNDYSLNEWLIDYLIDTNAITREQLKTFKPSVCNRLDRNTGGIVICGKSLLGIQVMTELIRTKDIEKHYITLCHGDFKHEGRTEAIISKDDKINKSSVSSDKNAEGSEIITEFSIIQKYNGACLLDVNLLTGKSHQIRAQLSAFGNPIYGDKKYGSGKAQSDKVENGLKYQLLYAYKLIFPASNKFPKELSHLSDKTIELPVPEYFQTVINRLN